MVSSRRGLLRWCGAALAGVAGCADDDAGSPASAPTTDSTPTDIPSTDTPTTTDTGTPTPVPGAEGDWRMVRQGPGNAAVAAGTAGPDGAPEVAWTAGRGGATGATGALVDGERVYFGANYGRYDDPAAEVVAVDADDGRVSWRTPTERAMDGPPAMAVGERGPYVATFTRAVTTDQEPGVGHLLALDDDGRRRWRVEGSPGSHLLVADGAVVWSLFRRDDDGFAGDLEAREAADGTRRWRATAGWPAYRDGTVYAAGASLVAVDAGSGEQRTLYEFATDDGVRAPPVVAGDAVYTHYVVDDTTTGALDALDPASGEVRWRTEIRGAPGATSLGAATLYLAGFGVTALRSPS